MASSEFFDVWLLFGVVDLFIGIWYSSFAFSPSSFLQIL